MTGRFRDLPRVGVVAAVVAGALAAQGLWTRRAVRAHLDEQVRGVGDALAEATAATLRGSATALKRLEDARVDGLRLKATFLSGTPRDALAGRRLLRRFAGAANLRRVLLFDAGGRLLADEGDPVAPAGSEFGEASGLAVARAARELAAAAPDEVAVREWRVPAAGRQTWLAATAPLAGGGKAVLLEDAGVFAAARRAAGREAVRRRLEDETRLVYVRLDEPAPPVDEERVYRVERRVDLGGGAETTVRLGIDRGPMLRALAVRRRSAWIGGAAVVLLVSVAAWALFAQRRARAALARRLVRDERLAGLGRLAANIAHEVRNPLNAIGIAVQRLQRGDADVSGEAVRGLATRIHDEVRRLDRTVEAVLQHARPGPAAAVRVEAGDLLRAVAELVAPEAAARGVRIAVDAPDALVVRGDPDLLKGALLNLVRNALRASPDGGTVDLAARAGRGEVRFAVRDDGPGVPDELRAVLFEPFATGARGGSGLGLSLALAAAQAHGGTIEVEDRPEGGARFVLRVPAEDDA